MSKKRDAGRSAGRPRSGNRRARHFCVRFSEEEWRCIEAHAAGADERPSSYVRTRTLDLIGAGGRLPVPATRSGAEERRELRAIGVLLTQIEAYTNEGGDADLGSSLAELQEWIVSRVRRR